MNIPYSESQKALLVEEVCRLCQKLNRPVSSKDLLDRWAAHPERRPTLLQSPGQLLFKAARPVKRENPVLFQVGLIGNLAFYAEDDSTHWREQFRLHEIRTRALRHVKWDIPAHALFLLGTEHEPLARNALAGFAAEWAPIAANRRLSAALPEDMQYLLDVAQNASPGQFTGTCPVLLARPEATAVLVGGWRDRSLFSGGPANINRHLAGLAWPQTPLFAQAGFWEFQVRQYSLWKWPDDLSDAFVAKAVVRCAAYGQK